MEYGSYEYEVELTNMTGVDMNSSLESYWSLYSSTAIIDECPELTVESARHVFDTVVYSQAHKVFTGIFLPILLCIGLIGNLLFLYVVCSMPAMRTATNWFLANLAVADMLFLSFAIGDKLWMYHHSPFINDRLSFGEFGCPVIFTFIDASYFAAICMVTLVSMERYYAVCRMHSARTSTRKTLFIALVVVSWILSIAIAASFVPASTAKWTGCRKWPDIEPYKDLPMYTGSCTATRGLETYPIYVNIAKTIPFLVLVILNCWMYVCIVRSITRANRDTRISGRRDTNLKQRNQIAGMLVVNGLIFFICLVPFEIFCLLQAINMIRDEPVFTQRVVVPLRYVSQTMSYINNVINPIIYIGMSERYRDAFKKAILCRKKVEHPSTIETETSTAISGQTLSSVDTKL